MGYETRHSGSSTQAQSQTEREETSFMFPEERQHGAVCKVALLPEGCQHGAACRQLVLVNRDSAAIDTHSHIRVWLVCRDGCISPDANCHHTCQISRRVCTAEESPLTSTGCQHAAPHRFGSINKWLFILYGPLQMCEWALSVSVVIWGIHYLTQIARKYGLILKLC